MGADCSLNWATPTPHCRLENEIDEDDWPLEAEIGLMDKITSLIQQHHFPIMALGSGRSALQDKYYSVLHAIFVEAGSTQAALADYGASLVAGTFDLGVEFSLNTIAPQGLRTLLPWAVYAEEPTRESADDFEMVDDAENLAWSLEGMLAVPGPLHVLDNATSSMLEAMPFLSSAVEPLTALSKFLAHSTTCHRLVATCFNSAMGEACKDEVLRYRSKVHSGRWGTLAFSVAATLQLEATLSQFWSLDKYLYGKRKEQERAQDATGLGIKTRA